MNPQLQVAFDVMYSRSECFLPANIAKQCTLHIRKGSYGIAIGEVAAALAEYTPIVSTVETHIKAVAAFGEFWAKLTETIQPVAK